MIFDRSRRRRLTSSLTKESRTGRVGDYVKAGLPPGGRDRSRRYPDDLMRYALFALLALSLALPSLAAVPARAAGEAPTCGSLLELHAMLTRAQMQCGFGRYNQALIDRAGACARGVPEAELKAVMMKGFAAFDASATASGKPGVCAAVLRQFPQFVRR